MDEATIKSMAAELAKGLKTPEDLNQMTAVFKKFMIETALTGGNVEAYLRGNQLKDSINIGEYSPELDDNGIYILPASGEYEIRVLQPRSQARKDKKPQYWMSINIK